VEGAVGKYQQNLTRWKDLGIPGGLKNRFNKTLASSKTPRKWTKSSYTTVRCILLPTYSEETKGGEGGKAGRAKKALLPFQS